ncbi:MAG: hypothetical protein RI968_579 [Pseudomonadota bacterium]|jgi:nicotinamide-nucleotide amidase
MNEPGSMRLCLGLALGWAAQRADCKIFLTESCTGGMACAWLAGVAGSSAWLEGGVVTYSNAMKRALLGVTEASLLAHGAVSSAVAAEMVGGASGLSARATGPLASASITGIAGPSGGTPEKPVGTVWFAWKLPDQSVLTQTRRFEGDRAQVQAQAAHWALSGLFSLLVQASGRASAQ